MTDISIRIYAFVTSALSSMKREEGQDLIEYALLGGLIAVAIMAAVTAGVLSGAIGSMVGGIRDCVDFTGATTCAPGP